MPDELEEKVLATLRDPGYRPMNKSELARHLEVPPKDRAALRAVLRDLEDRGELLRGKHGRYQRREESGNVLVGSIRFRPDGHALLVVDPDDPQNRPLRARFGEASRIFIPRRQTMTALEGDRVAVRVQHAGIPKWWRHVKAKRELVEDLERSGELRLEGRVVRVLVRAGARFTGTFARHGRFLGVEPDDPAMPPGVRVAEADAADARPGEMVVAVIDRWDSRDSTPVGRVVERIGSRTAPGADVLAIIYRHHLPTEFPDDVLAEAARVSETVEPDELARREDWRDRLVVTIDPFDARDFDDAISVERLPDADGGGWELAVHIADVSHYVPPGSKLDAEALERGNSVYLVDRVLPMLPETLSNGICSLKPDVERLTFAVIMRFDGNAAMTHARFTPAVIRSRARFTYEQVFGILRDGGALAPEGASAPTPAPADAGGPATDPQAAMLAEAWRLAARLRRRRFGHGALDLDFAEVKVHLDEQGVPTRLERIEHDESHQLIEEFMLAANEAVARHVQHASRPAIYRIHEEPDAGKLFEFTELLRIHGIRAGDLTQRGELQKVIGLIRGKPEEHALKLALLRSLKRAAYAALPLGHFGLAKDHYTHFTSPIRRYADLVVHRVLRRLVDPEARALPVPAQKRLEEIAAHISETERVAADAELESVRLKELEYLDKLVRDPDAPAFRAVVFESRPIGIFVELEAYQIKGLIPRRVLEQQDLFFSHGLQRFTDPRERRGYRVGDELDVRVIRVDFDRLFVDFAPA